MKRVGPILTAVLLSIFLVPSQLFAAPAQGVVITELMTASTTSASSEFVELYNQSDSAIDLTNWKVQYQSASADILTGSWTTKATLEGQLRPRGFLLLGTSIFDNEAGATSDITLSSGLAGSAGKVRVFDNTNVIDSLAWGNGTIALEGTAASSAEAGISYKRLVDADAQFIDTNDNSADFEVSASPYAQGGGLEDVGEEVIDVCPATPEIDTSVPDGYEIDDSGSCAPIATGTVCENGVYLSEILPNPEGLEADGGEFIELYNPADETASLEGCILVSSKSSQPVVAFTPADTIVAKGYYVIYITDKLTNSSGSVTFVTDSREDMVSYSGMNESESLALFGGVWAATNMLTPGSENQPYQEPDESFAEPVSSSLTPCAEGKYRNPETNRCKTIETANGELQPCDAGQYRNPETNRCKKLEAATAGLTPCSEGQERNPDTNRCRKIVVASATLKACAEGQERNPETNRCRKISTFSSSQQFAATEDDGTSSPIKLGTLGVASLSTMALGYAAYEYRSDLKNLYQKARGQRPTGKPPD